MVCRDNVSFGSVWYDLVCFGMKRYGFVSTSIIHVYFIRMYLLSLRHYFARM